MKMTNRIPERIYNLQALTEKVQAWRLTSKTVAFTNGVFDLLHAGHLKVLNEAAQEADILIVAVNSNASVKRLKGEGRPVNNEDTRALMLASMIMVDAVIVFDEDTPLEVIQNILPEVLIKGGDYTEDTIVGAKEVKANGGRVVIVDLEEDQSTTGMIQKIRGGQ